MNAANDDPAVNYRSDSQSFKPYDKASEGYIMSEGAALVVLEAKDHAQQRDAHIYAKISG